MSLDLEDQNTGARGLAWPILGGWGPSDPSSNLGGPTFACSLTEP
mgnify:CR=1 FL=1